MSKKGEKIFVIAAAALVIFAFFYVLKPNTLLGSFLHEISEVNWEEVKERDIVKNSIPVVLLETIDGKCKVTANNFDVLIKHEYFVRGNELARELNYDRQNETLLISCDLLHGEKSRLNVWYVKEESAMHSKKYQYFVIPWEDATASLN